MISQSKFLSHSRSSSLPSRSHPLIPHFTHHLHKLHHASDHDSPSLPSITNNLHNLSNLFTCLDDLLLLHRTHQVFSQESQEKWVEQILDGYLGLVDACATAKELVFHAKEHLTKLLSLLRRRRDDFSDDLPGLLNSRKAAQKMIHKSLRSIGGLKSKPSVTALDKDQETIAVVSMLKETESATLDIIESLLFSLAGAKGSSRWGLVSRLIGRSSGHDRVEFAEIDGLLCKISTVSFRISSSSRCEDVGVQIDELQQQLRCADASLCFVEEELESLFKRLIRTRVSLLNMHSQ